MNHGGAKGAAAHLHMTRGAVFGVLQTARRALGCETTEQLIALGARDGWLELNFRVLTD